MRLLYRLSRRLKLMYCTAQNMIDRFGLDEMIQLTDRAHAGVIDQTVLAQAIADAEAEIDSYLTLYNLPLSTIPSNFERIASDITRYYLYDILMATHVQLRYDACIRYLKEVSDGRISLGPDNSGTVAQEALSLVQITSSPSVFSR